MKSAILTPQEFERIRANMMRECDPYYRLLAEIENRAARRYIFSQSSGLTTLPYESSIQQDVDALNAKIKEIQDFYLEEINGHPATA